jgi:hypothetical protein
MSHVCTLAKLCETVKYRFEEFFLIFANLNVVAESDNKQDNHLLKYIERCKCSN